MSLTSAERERFLKGWSALRDACRKQHPRGPGGAALCACGAGCGGSEACFMLRIVRDLIEASDERPDWWENYMEALRSVIH